jgi:hypothetical protein
VNRLFHGDRCRSAGTARVSCDQRLSPPKVQLFSLQVQHFLSVRPFPLNSTDSIPTLTLGTRLRKGDEGSVRKLRPAAHAVAHESRTLRAAAWASSTPRRSAPSLVRPVVTHLAHRDGREL